MSAGVVIYKYVRSAYRAQCAYGTPRYGKRVQIEGARWDRLPARLKEAIKDPRGC